MAGAHGYTVSPSLPSKARRPRGWVLTKVICVPQAPAVRKWACLSVYLYQFHQQHVEDRQGGATSWNKSAALSHHAASRQPGMPAWTSSWGRRSVYCAKHRNVRLCLLQPLPSLTFYPGIDPVSKKCPSYIKGDALIWGICISLHDWSTDCL